MKIYISADMEGVTHSQDVMPGRSQYERFRRLLTTDVNAAIEGAAQAGATEFLVNEATTACGISSSITSTRRLR